jgi:WD40 repeat protein
MSSLKASPQRLQRIKQARIDRGWSIDNIQWLKAASKVLEPNMDWDNSDQVAVSIGSWRRFLNGEAIRPQVYQAFCQVLGLNWQETSETSPSTKVTTNCDWGEVPDTAMFAGRAVEIETLKRWIIGDEVRLVALLGIGGVGKTALAAQVAQGIAGEFEYVIWRSLREAPPVEKIIGDCIKLVSRHNAIDLPDSLGEKITMLIDRLRSARCLIILDNAESILQAGSLAGSYHPLSKGYGDLFRRIGESAHQSCVMVTSREQFKDLRRLQGDDAPVRVLQLGGLQQSAVKILNRKGIFGSEGEIEWLISQYQGNPLALEIVAATIRNTFNYSIADFLQIPTVFGEIKDLLTVQFDRLSGAEQSVIYWLAIRREPVSSQELLGDLLDGSIGLIITAIDSLLDRSLIQSTSEGFTLQNVVMEYVSDRFIDQIWSELDRSQFDLFRTHAIIQATAKDYIRETQQRLLLAPIIERMTKDRSLAIIEHKFRSMISYFREEQINSHQLEEYIVKYNPRTGYAIGNIINLLLGLQINLTGYDFSYLPICQAYLQNVNLHAVNFSYCHFNQTVFSQALGSIFTVTFSPDQKLLATGGMDGQVRIWRVADGEQLLAWQAHGDWIRNVTFSPDGKMLASSSNDCTVRVWDWEQMNCLHVLRGHSDWVWSARFVVWKGLLFLISVSSDRTGKIWNLNLGKCVFTVQEPDDLMWAVAFSSNGYTLASSSVKSVKLWNIWTRKCVRIIVDDSSRIRALAFSPDGKTLVGSDDNSIKVWDVVSGACLNSILVTANSSIWSMIFSPNGQKLISAGTDKIQIWNAASWEALTTLSEPQYRIRSIAYSLDQTMVAVGSDEQLVRIWDTKTGRSIKTFSGVSNRIWTIAVSPKLESGDIYLASGSDDAQIRIWNPITGELLKTLIGHTGRIRSLAFSPSGKILASASHDRTIKLWDVSTGKQIKTWRGHTDWVWAVQFGSDDRTIISASDDRTILIWDTQTNESQLIQDAQAEWIWSIASHPHLPLIAIAGSNPQIELWSLNTNTIQTLLNGNAHRIRSIVFNPAGDKLASSSDDLTIKLWNIDRHQCLNTLVGHTKEIRALTFIPASATTPEMLVSASDDLTLRLWDTETGACVKILNAHAQSIWSICYSPELRILFSCSQDETIELWDLDTFSCINILTLPKSYQGMNITRISGLSGATETTLFALGAVAR